MRYNLRKYRLEQVAKKILSYKKHLPIEVIRQDTIKKLDDKKGIKGLTSCRSLNFEVRDFT
ncbi:hypothetical protein AusDCA_1297 [Desulfitobacterium sp. AusDCA]